MSYTDIFFTQRMRQMPLHIVFADQLISRLVKLQNRCLIYNFAFHSGQYTPWVFAFNLTVS